MDSVRLSEQQGDRLIAIEDSRSRMVVGLWRFRKTLVACLGEQNFTSILKGIDRMASVMLPGRGANFIGAARKPNP